MDLGRRLSLLLKGLLSRMMMITLQANGLDGGQQIDPALPRDFKGLSFTSVDKIILEAITNLNRPLGPDGKSILLYVEEKNNIQPDMKRLVTSRLKHLMNVGIIIKIKHIYRISPAAGAKQSSPQLFLEGNKEIKGMTAQEAAEVAARAVAEAEFAIAEAEEAAREADEAEAAHIFAKAAMKAFKYRMHSQTW